MMDGNQLLRAFGVGAVVTAYVARLMLIGNGDVSLFGYEMELIALVAFVIILLISPETIEYLPFGPSRKKG